MKGCRLILSATSRYPVEYSLHKSLSMRKREGDNVLHYPSSILILLVNSATKGVQQ